MGRTCDDCDTTGFRYVQRAYAESEAKRRMAASANPVTPEDDPSKYEGLVATFLNTVYPCRTCNPSLFFRWAGGHLAADHDRDACGECIEAGSGSGRGRGAPRKPFVVTPPPPAEPPPGWDDLERDTRPAPAEPEPEPLPLDHAMRAAGSD